LSRLATSKRAVAPEKLSIDTIRNNSVLAFPLQIVSAAKFSESPLPADDDLLTTRELELGTAKRFLGVIAVTILAADRQKHLANANPSASTLRLAKSTPHSGLEPISPSTGKHLVDPKNMERVNPNPKMESILPGIFGHVLVAGNASSLKSFTRNIFFLPAY